MKVNRHDQAKILLPQEIAWLLDGKVGLVSGLKLFRLLVLLGKTQGMEAIAFLSLLSYIEGLPPDRDRALFSICLYITARVNEACSLHTADVYGSCAGARSHHVSANHDEGEAGDAIRPSVAGVEAIIGGVSERSSLPISRTLG